MGETHLEAGRIREALHEFLGLVEQYPDEALGDIGIWRVRAGADETLESPCTVRSCKS